MSIRRKDAGFSAKPEKSTMSQEMHGTFIAAQERESPQLTLLHYHKACMTTK
jgi:hypothetical protein